MRSELFKHYRSVDVPCYQAGTKYGTAVASGLMTLMVAANLDDEYSRERFQKKRPTNSACDENCKRDCFVKRSAPIQN